MLLLVDHYEGSDVVGYSLSLCNTTIRLLNDVEVLVDVFELRANDSILRYSEGKQGNHNEIHSHSEVPNGWWSALVIYCYLKCLP